MSPPKENQLPDDVISVEFPRLTSPYRHRASGIARRWSVVQGQIRFGTEINLDPLPTEIARQILDPGDTEHRGNQAGMQRA
ncbi:hypothetical protein RRG08_009658 [Elysia crispata]|uniref:Uncharacterized protein n=1 Tax=Elysia crispata TaxID=231223 RepID=A0AAE1DMJ0_9GAST|nr:hypothetical protein RRG08_009658 [Elysia crispata]